MGVMTQGLRNRGVRLAGVLAAAVLAGVGGGGASRLTGEAGATSWSAADKAAMAERVKGEMLVAWGGYKKYAWGHDEFRPLSQTPRDWYKRTLLMTPVDALDTLILMGATEQADEARELIATKLDLDLDDDVKAFEINIRLLGGLLSSYQLSGDKRLLALADDLGRRLLPVFESPTGLPYVYVNLHTGKASGTDTNPAEMGTYLMEFGTLSKLTGKPIYLEKAKRAVTELYARRSKLDLVGQGMDSATGKWTNTESHVGGCIDSYYEYLLKSAILLDDSDCRKMWDASVAGVNRYVADERGGELWYGVSDMNTGKHLRSECGALDAFWAGALALGGDVPRAARAQDAYFKVWNLHGIEPEETNYAEMKALVPSYVLRPEIVESTFYLSRFTSDPKYLDMGKTMFDDLEKYCRVEHGFAALKSVVTHEKEDQMESFFLAETMKYYYMIYAPAETLDLSKAVLNTEAHPLRRTW